MSSRALLPILCLCGLLLAGCNAPLDEVVGGLNNTATQAAGGLGGPTITPGGPTLTPEFTATPTATATPSAVIIDLSTSPNSLLGPVWGQTYALASGTQFQIKATDRQVGDYVIQTLQLAGYDEYVRGGATVIGSGQIRLDLALVGTDAQFGGGTITFQPTLDEQGRIRLNPLGGDFGTLLLPSDLLAAFGDSVHSAMTGAPTPELARVTVQSFTLDGAVMIVNGTVK